MNKKSISAHTLTSDVPYDLQDTAAVDTFWANAVPHTGLHELKAKRGRPKKPTDQLKQQISFRVDADVLEWYRSLGSGWQTQMNAVLKNYKDSSGNPSLR